MLLLFQTEEGKHTKRRRHAPLVEADGPAANPYDNEQNPPNNNNGDGGRRGHRERDEENVAQPPAVRPRPEEREPIWTLESGATDVLIRRYGGQLGMTVNDFLQRYAGGRVAKDGKGGNPLEWLFTQPHVYVDGEIMEEVQQSAPYEYLEAVYNLNNKGMATLRAWRSAKKEERKPISPPVVRILDVALEAALETRNDNAKAINEGVIEGVYDPVFNATWSHVVVDRAAQTLKLRIVDGLPDANLIWSDEEVNVVPTVEEVVIDPPEQVEGLGLLCLTSQKGWPYTQFRNERHNDVLVRREDWRVWNILERDLRSWSNRGAEGLECKKRAFIVIGDPGIGKSLAIGSLLLHQLLRYDVDVVQVVLYIIGESVYIFDKTANGGRGVVVSCGVRTVDDITMEMSSTKKGYIIFDVLRNMKEPNPSLPRNWGSVVLSSPNPMNFQNWQRQRDGVSIIVNCWTMSELKTFFVCKKDNLSPGVRDDELEATWQMYEGRVKDVGPAPRYIFGEDAFRMRKNQVVTDLGKIESRDERLLYAKMLRRGKDWYENEVAHTLIRRVRVRADGGAEWYTCEPHSEGMRESITRILVTATALERFRIGGPLPSSDMIPALFEANAKRSFIHPGVLCHLVENIKPLPHVRGAQEGGDSTILKYVEKAYMKFEKYEVLPGYIGGLIDSREPIEVYDPPTGFPVADAMFVVNADKATKEIRGDPKLTVVMMQFTKADKHHTSSGAVIKLLERLAVPASTAEVMDWKSVKDRFRWEIIYVQSVDATMMDRRQKCYYTPGGVGDPDHKEAMEFWDKSVHQYLVKFDTNIIAIIVEQLMKESIMQRRGFARVE